VRAANNKNAQRPKPRNVVFSKRARYERVVVVRASYFRSGRGFGVLFLALSGRPPRERGKE